MVGKQDELRDDLNYVRGALQESDRTGSGWPIYVLWGLLILIGFSLQDFTPGWVPAFWMIAGPIGFLMSLYFGYRASVKQGQASRRQGFRHAAHWLGMMIGIGATIPLAATGVLDWDALSRVILLILALGYFMAGVHLDRHLVWAGGLMMAGYVVLFFIETHVWTLLGVVIGASLFLGAALTRAGSGD